MKVALALLFALTPNVASAVVRSEAVRKCTFEEIEKLKGLMRANCEDTLIRATTGVHHGQYAYSIRRMLTNASVECLTALEPAYSNATTGRWITWFILVTKDTRYKLEVDAQERPAKTKIYISRE